ncbi:34682_t:CDS:1, partial [Gigaspora margarita]
MELEFNKTNINQVYKLFDAFNEVGPSLDDSIALKMRLNKSLLLITKLYLGLCTKAQNAMECFINASNPISTKFIPQTFFEPVEALSKHPNKYYIVNPEHNPNFFKAKSFFVNRGKGLMQQAIKVLVNFVNNAVCTVLASFNLFSGAVNVNDSSFSFIHHDALYCIQIESDWDTEEDITKCINEIN